MDPQKYYLKVKTPQKAANVKVALVSKCWMMDFSFTSVKDFLVNVISIKILVEIHEINSYFVLVIESIYVKSKQNFAPKICLEKDTRSTFINYQNTNQVIAEK